MTLRGVCIGLTCVGSVFFALDGTPLYAWPVEHNAPLQPPVKTTPQSFSEPAETDTVPIGPELRALHVIDGPNGSQHSTATNGLGDVQVASIEAPFIGRPISRRMIADIEAELDRQLGPAPSVTAKWVPGDGLNGGVLEFHLVDFVVGQVTVTGERSGEQDYLKKQLELRKGQAIDRGQFAFDLDTLNRYPFRQAKAVYSPDSSALSVEVSRQRPWQFYAGTKYADLNQHQWRRYIVGGSVGDLIGLDSLLSFQLTASPMLTSHGVRYPDLADGLLSYTKPVTRHGALEASFEVTRYLYLTDPQAEAYDITDVVGTIGYRLVLRPKATGTESDIRFGAEAKHERVVTMDNGIVTTQEGAEIYQTYAGYHHAEDMASSHGDLDVSLHFHPGGVDAGDSDAHYDEYYQGRLKSAHYAYVDVNYDYSRHLEGAFAWHSFVTSQLATGPLPYSEEWSVGGTTMVRGYGLYDGTYDDFVVVRNELGRSTSSDGPVDLNLFAFVDLGVGRDASQKSNRNLGSAGIATALPLTRQITLTLDIAHTLYRTPVSPSGRNVIEANLLAKF